MITRSGSHRYPSDVQLVSSECSGDQVLSDLWRERHQPLTSAESARHLLDCPHKRLFSEQLLSR